MRCISKINIICLIIICLILLYIENVDAVQEINKTIQINEYYKQGFDLGAGDNLSLNLTTDNYADFFFLSEQGLIDYEISKVPKPSHVNWYRLNTTSFSENLTVDTSGIYFLIVSNEQNPNSEYMNKTLNLSESYDIKKQQIQRGNISYERIISALLILLLATVAFIVILIKWRKNLAAKTLVIISLLCLGFVVGDFPIFTGDITQELYLLSSLLQGLITLLAIVVSINFVIAQTLSQMYTSATAKLVIRNPLFILFLTMNLTLIALLVLSLSDIDFVNGYYKINGELVYRYIDFIIIFFILAISTIIPYIYETIQIMNPAVIIDKLIEEVTFNNLLNSSKLRKNLITETGGSKTSIKSVNYRRNRLINQIKSILVVHKSINYIYNRLINQVNGILSNYESVNYRWNRLINQVNNILSNYESISYGWNRIINYFNNILPTKIIESEPDGLQPIRDIANKAINDSNYEILRIASNKLEEWGEKYVLNAKINDNDKAIIAEHFGYHLYKIAETAIIKKDFATITSIVNALLEINKASEKDAIAFETIVYIGKIGRKCASDRLENNAYDVIDSLGLLGQTFASKEWIKSTDMALNEISAISEELIQNELLITRSKSIMSNFDRIAKKAVETQLDFQITKALLNSQMIADHIMKYKKNIFVIPGELRSFLPILEEVGTKITSEMVNSIGILPAIIDDVGKMGEYSQDTDFIKKLTRTLIVIGINLSKQNIAKDNVLKTLVMLNSKNPSVQNEWGEVEKIVSLTDKDFFDKLKLEFLKSLQQNKKKSRRA